MTPDQLRQLEPLMAKAQAEGWADWVRDDRDRLAMLDGCWFDVSAAEKFRTFCSRFLRLEHPRYPNKTIPFDLLDFQYRDILGPLMGWKRADGTRRYRFGFVSVAKGNTKSAMAAAVLLYMTFGEGEPVALGYAASTSAKTARAVWEFAARMVRNSPQLRKSLKIIEHTGRIIDPKRRNVLQIVPNRADAIEGKDVAVCVYDEVHLAKDRKLFDAIEHGGRSRRQPLVLCITTAASDETSLAFELYDDAKKLLSGAIVDHSRFAYIAECTRDDDPTDPATWAKANPALGLTVNKADFKSLADHAQASPAKMVNFQRRRLNVWGLAEHSAFIDFAKWKACRANISPDDLTGRECYLGLDLSSNTDLTAAVAVFPSPDGTIDVLAWHWLPRDVLAERAKTDCDKYPQWAREGWLELTDGDYIDMSLIRQRIIEIGRKFKVKEIAYDPTFASELGPKLAESGFQVFEFWQRPRMYSPVMACLDSHVLGGRIRHNNPLLDWQISNLQARTNEDGHMKPAKPSAGKKIDGACALLMAMGNIVKQNNQPKPYAGDKPELILLG
jgi:phage terminase large subunit-like protein